MEFKEFEIESSTAGFPNHPLYNELCEKANLLLPQLSFKKHCIRRGKISFISPEGMTVTVVHQGYDMPSICIGNQSVAELITSWKPLEYYVDKKTPLAEKYQQQRSYYDFQFHYDLIKSHYKELLNIVYNSEAYNKWLSQVDFDSVFENKYNYAFAKAGKQNQMRTKTLYRPVGLIELQLIYDTCFTAFPPRLEWQPIFYLVLNEAYAIEIATRWNLDDKGSGYSGFVTSFEVEEEFLKRYKVENVGGKIHNELWVPSVEMELFNDNIKGKIEVIKMYFGTKFQYPGNEGLKKFIKQHEQYKN